MMILKSIPNSSKKKHRTRLLFGAQKIYSMPIPNGGNAHEQYRYAIRPPCVSVPSGYVRVLLSPSYIYLPATDAVGELNAKACYKLSFIRLSKFLYAAT